MAVTTEFVKSRALREMTVTLTYEDSTGVVVFTLPAGSRVLTWAVIVRTAFNGETPMLDVAAITGSEGTSILSGVDISTAGLVELTTELVEPGYETEAVTPIYAGVSEGSTEGELDLTCVFSVDKLTRM